MAAAKIKLLRILILICMLDNIILSVISVSDQLYIFLFYFILSTVAYIPAYIIAPRKPLQAYIMAACMVNALMFIFDGGINGKGKEFVYYLPIIISYYIFIPTKYRLLRNGFICFSLGLLLLSTFTSIGPKLRIELYSQIQPQLNIVAITNLFIALWATISMLQYFITTNERDQQEMEELNEKLTEAEFRWNFALNVANDGVWDWNIKTNEAFYSDKWKQQLGYEPHEIDNHYSEWFRILHPDDKAGAIERFYNFIEGKLDLYESTFRLLAKDGSYRWIKSRGQFTDFDLNNQPIRIIGTHADITEVIASQEALQKNEQMLESINRNIVEGIYRSTYAEGMVFVNDAFVKMFGYRTKEEMLGLDPDMLYKDPLDRVRLMYSMDQYGFVANQELELKKKNGESFWGLLSSTKVTGPDGEVYYDGGLRDITHLKHIERELREARNRAEKALRVKGDFISMISHELRTPLNAITGFTEILQKNSPRKDQETSLEMLRYSGNNLKELINNVLEFGELDSGEFTIRESSFDLNELTGKIVQTYAHKALHKNLKLVTNFDKALHYEVISDPVRLGQVLNNLIDNAIKYTHTGHIMVSFVVAAETNDSYRVKFSVKDSGIGISSEKTTVIFDSFTQLHKPINRSYEGSGLGLTIAQNIVKRLGGNIEVVSELDEGSEFSFTIDLPVNMQRKLVQKEPEGGKLVGFTPEISSRSEMRNNLILLVDDNKVNVLLLKQHLDFFGIPYCVASNGLEAIESMHMYKPDMIIMDIHMPEMNGIDATERILQTNPEVAIVGLTADNSSQVRQAAMDAGMKDVMIKPVNMELLLGHINRYSSIAVSA
jgi:PAS domain S-box-containing protein